jgi:hypothetical protein
LDVHRHTNIRIGMESFEGISISADTFGLSKKKAYKVWNLKWLHSELEVSSGLLKNIRLG